MGVGYNEAKGESRGKFLKRRGRDARWRGACYTYLAHVTYSRDHARPQCAHSTPPSSRPPRARPAPLPRPAHCPRRREQPSSSPAPASQSPTPVFLGKPRPWPLHVNQKLVSSIAISPLWPSPCPIRQADQAASCLAWRSPGPDSRKRVSLLLHRDAALFARRCPAPTAQLQLSSQETPITLIVPVHCVISGTLPATTASLAPLTLFHLQLRIALLLSWPLAAPQRDFQTIMCKCVLLASRPHSLHTPWPCSRAQYPKMMA